MGNEIHFSVTSILYDDLSKYANRVASSLAQQTADALEKKYLYVITRFYGEYKPSKYKRHEQRGMEPGLPKSLNISLHPYGGGIYGGIEMTSDKMYDDYGDSPDEVLEHFLSGYHGDPSRRIKSNIETEKYMDEYCDSLVLGIQKFVPEAENYAKTFNYSVLRF